MANTMKAPYPPTATAADSSPAKVIYVAPAEDSDTCECTAGWWMFGLGWWLCVPWAVGACLPFCSKGSRPNVRRNNMRAAIGSAVMLLLSIAAIIAIVVMVTRGGGGSTTVTSTRGTGSSAGSSRTFSSNSPGLFNIWGPAGPPPGVEVRAWASDSRLSSSESSSSSSRTGPTFQG